MLPFMRLLRLLIAPPLLLASGCGPSATLPEMPSPSEDGNIQVQGRLLCPSLGRPPVDVMVAAFPARSERPVVRSSWTQGRFQIRLKPGEYMLQLEGVEIQPMVLNLMVPDDSPAIDLGDVELEPSILAASYGKPPPDWLITEARGIPDSLTPADLKGRWTLLVFWGFW